VLFFFTAHLNEVPNRSAKVNIAQDERNFLVHSPSKEFAVLAEYQEQL
jgi:hypothetical protein